MRKVFLIFLAAIVFSSHDMFLKLDSYSMPVDQIVTFKLFNGTFNHSDNTIARHRMVDVRLAGVQKQISIDTTQWREKGNVTMFDFETSDGGTWIAGVSTRPQVIELNAADFNEYLEHDGVLDMLQWRRENDGLDQDAVERYSKHVKTIFQVGDTLSDDWKTVLGYPVEFVPLSNPYATHSGHDIQFRLLWHGEPLADQLVYAGKGDEDQEHTHEHGAESAHAHTHDKELRTNVEGVVTVPLTSEGIWYLRTIYLTLSDDPSVTHESNWATITFGVGHGHSHDAHDQDHAHDHHDHDHEEPFLGIPGYVYLIASIVFIAILFFWYNRRNS